MDQLHLHVAEARLAIPEIATQNPGSPPDHLLVGGLADEGQIDTESELL